jgi:hypothetical protein
LVRRSFPLLFKETLMRLSLLRSAVLGLSLLGAGLAFADVAPPADGGSTPDMTTTMAKPDMSAVTEPKDDDGCSMAHRSASTNAAALLFGASAIALAVTRRRA